MKVTKGSWSWVYGDTEIDGASFLFSFDPYSYPYGMMFRFTKDLPYRRRDIAIKSTGIYKDRSKDRGQVSYWAKFIFEKLKENKYEGAGDEIK
jgi:hypothetical protein